MENVKKQSDRGDINDLTHGNIVRKLFLFFLPIAAGTLFQQFYNTVDAFVVSKYVGTEALAAVGGSPAIVISLIIGFCTSLAGGCSVVISQLYGGGYYTRVKTAVKTSYVFCIILGAVVGVAVIIFSPELLRLLKTTDDTFADSLKYQRIYFSAGVFLMVFNMGSGILRAVGDSRFPFISLFISCGINIVLDILFVAVFDMGVGGVAWATVIAQGVSAVIVTVKLMYIDPDYSLSHGSAFDGKMLLRMLKIGIPSGLQSSMYGISNMILQIGVNSLGTVVIASWAMSGKIDGIYWALTNAFGVAVTTFIGQNYGAGYLDRVRKTSRQGMAVFTVLTFSIIGLILLIGKPMLNIITDDSDVASTTWYIMMYFVPYYMLWSIIEMYSGVLRGIGDTVVPSIIIAVGICVSRIAWVYTVFAKYGTLSVLCMCYLVSWGITDIAIFVYYLYKSKHLKSIITV